MKQNSELDDIFARFHKPEIPIFKDRDSLHATYIPESLPHREKEIQNIANILGPIMRGQVPSNTFLYGKPGAGKTAVIKFIISYLKDKAEGVGVSFSYAYFNCQMIDTSYRLYAALCKHLGASVPSTGLPTTDIFEIFKAKLEEKKIHLSIILDEIDLLAKKSKASESLYTLTRLNSDLVNSKISIIGITNNVAFKESIDPRVRSTLMEQEIVFPPYTASQLSDILRERSVQGFVEGVVDPSAIARAAALAASEHGDARRALDLLRVAGEIAERNQEHTVNSVHVKEALSKIELDTVAEITFSLPIHSKAVLLSIVKLDIFRQNAKKSDASMIDTGKIFNTYDKTCHEIGMNTLTMRRMGDLLQELDLLGLIRANVISKGRYGRTRVIELAVTRIEILRVLEKENRLFDFLPERELW